MSRNDITGDSLVSKAATDEYRTNLERVFGVKKPWYIRRDEQAQQEQTSEHRQAEAGQASATDER
jgi:hypothetical protein